MEASGVALLGRGVTGNPLLWNIQASSSLCCWHYGAASICLHPALPSVDCPLQHSQAPLKLSDLTALVWFFAACFHAMWKAYSQQKVHISGWWLLCVYVCVCV